MDDWYEPRVRTVVLTLTPAPLSKGVGIVPQERGEVLGFKLDEV
jgi:hypothetical protein